MSKDIFQSSDSTRSGSPLKHVQYVTFDEPLDMELGGRLEQVRVAYETYGRLNAAKDNAVLVCHPISGDSHVTAHDADDDPGWWDVIVGPGKAIDTNKYFVICPNMLGGCRGTTGPNCVNPATGEPYGPDFPDMTIGDTVEVYRRVVDHLGIETLLAVIGGSMGGMQVMDWVVRYPGRARAAIPVATAPRLTSQALAFDVIGRNAIIHSADFHGGHYYGRQNGVRGLAVARMIGHITYLSREAMRAKFGADRNQPRDIDSEFEKDTSIASYLAHQGDKFVERFDANSYLTITRAVDRFDFGEAADLAERLRPAQCRWLLISFSSDWLFPPEQSRQIIRALLASGRIVSYCNVRSACGHDAFLLQDEMALYGGLIAGFLARTHNGAVGAAEPAIDSPGEIGHTNTNIFHGRRLDCDSLEELITAEAPGESPSVLDLGCGDGQMLLRLKQRGWQRLQGVEIDQQRVLACVQRGIDCIHADLNDGLDQFTDKQFDCVLLSRTLQTVYNVDRVVKDMLRVGRRCIVSFPNFAFRPLRRMLAEQGLAPEADGLLMNKWYDTPNIRFFSIADFENYCRQRNATIHRLVALNTETHEEVMDDPNLNADLAIFVISKP